MDQVKAKFICTQVEDQPAYEQKRVRFSAVINNCEENKSFAKYTPSGNVEMWISYETPAVDFFTPGKEYFLTFEEAPSV